MKALKMLRMKNLKRRAQTLSHRWKRNYIVVPPKYTKPIEKNPVISDVMGEVLKSTLGR